MRAGYLAPVARSAIRALNEAGITDEVIAERLRCPLKDVSAFLAKERDVPTVEVQAQPEDLHPEDLYEDYHPEAYSHAWVILRMHENERQMLRGREERRATERAAYAARREAERLMPLLGRGLERRHRP